MKLLPIYRSTGSNRRRPTLAVIAYAQVDEADGNPPCSRLLLSSDGCPCWHEGRGKTIRLRNWIASRIGLSVQPGFIVDHKDRDKLNNQRSNFHLVSRHERMQNRNRFRSSKTGFKGVTRHSDLQKFQANIHRGGKQTYIGLFTTAEEAARSWDAKAREFGYAESALNFPNQQAAAYS